MSLSELSSANTTHNTTTHFAPAERKTRTELDQDIAATVSDPLISGLMSVANGLFAVLNDKRQVVALNNAFLEMMGIESSEQALGLRSGEMVQCRYAAEMPGGCGTSEYCSSCGAAISIMAALETRLPQERTCSLSVERDNQLLDMYFSVRTCPVSIAGQQYLLYFMQDISLQQHSSCLERTFFHDINNLLCALTMRSELLSVSPTPSAAKVGELHQIINRISQEFAVQHALKTSLDSGYAPIYAKVPLQDVLDDVAKIFETHPATMGRTLTIAPAPQELTITTDLHLVSRILVNMITNALEASPVHGEVRVSLEFTPNCFAFKVWNAAAMPDEVKKRIFQRNFSTKGVLGRGLGTYSMKLFAEKILGGTVHFESTPSDGTTFVLTLLDTAR